jgi:hypothetical protein
MTNVDVDRTEDTSAPTVDANVLETSVISAEPERQGRSISNDEQLKGYAHFLDKLKHPSAASIVDRVKHFVARFPRELRREQASERLHRFMSALEEELGKVEVFASSSEEELLDAKEGLEKLLLKPLHQHFFRLDPNDRLLDEELSGKISRISPLINLQTHLHGPSELTDDSILSLGIEELGKMDAYRAPRDKMQCILNCFRVIRHALDTLIGPSRWGADQLLPVCIYTIIRANPPSLNSNVNFIASFRHSSRLRGEDEYLLMQMNIAIRDIMEIEEVLLKPVSDLSITDLWRMQKRLKKNLLRMVDDGNEECENLLSREWRAGDLETFVQTYREINDQFNRKYK